MTASNELTCFLVWPLPETVMEILCNCLVGALRYIRYTLRDTIIPVVRSEGSLGALTTDVTRPPAMATAKKKRKKRYIDCLAHTVIDVFYSVAVNGPQPVVWGGGSRGGVLIECLLIFVLPLYFQLSYPTRTAQEGGGGSGPGPLRAQGEERQLG